MLDNDTGRIDMSRSTSVNFTVTEEAMRPAATARECFYCHQKIGDQHKVDCVLIKKKVRIRMVIEYEIEVPNDWDKAQIEFQRNEGSWCANNALGELRRAFDAEGVPCLCGVAEFEYLGGDSAPYLDE